MTTAMKVGVLGSGGVGQVLAAGLLKYGHPVMLGSRDPKKQEVQDWLAKTPGAQAGTFQDAARFGELLVLATMGRVAESVIDLAGAENFAGKTLMDATNPLAEGPPVQGVLPYMTGPNESLAERIQSKAPAAHVVKAFNSVGQALMVNPQLPGGPPTMFLCGDNEEAKSQVTAIVRQFGWEPYDCGGITGARALEPLCMLWCLPGFLRNDWQHAFKMLKA